MGYDNDTVEEIEELGISAAKSGTIYVGGEIATSLVTLVLLIFLARILQPSAFGLYAIAISFTGLLGIASNFGIGTAFRKMLPELKKADKRAMNRILSNGYAVAFALGLTIAIIGILISNFIGIDIYNNPGIVLALEIAAFAELFSVIFNLTQGALVGLGLVKEATIANGVYSILTLIFSVALVLLGYGVAGAIAGMLLGLVFGTAAGVAYVMVKGGMRFIGVDKKTSGKLTAFSAPVVASYVAMQGAQNFSILFLGVFAAASVVGNYGAAYKFARFVEIIITSITFVLVGTFSAALAKKKIANKIGDIYNKSLFYTAIFLFPLIAYFVSVSQPVTTLLFSSQYSSTPLYFAIIVVGMAIGIIGSFAGTLIISNGDTKKFMKYQIVAVVIQLVLLFVLTPRYQAVGVLVALYLITPILLNVLYMRALEEQFKFKQKFGRLARITLVSVAIGVALFGLSMYLEQTVWLIVVNAIVLMALFPPLAGLTGSLNMKELDFVSAIGARLGPLRHVVNPLVGYAKVFAN
jgi:O-antigen/teichoic acid export membrane protein